MSCEIVPGPPVNLRPRFIGVAGVAGSGKDTVCNMVMDVLGGVKLSLAAPFKEFAGNVFLFDEDQLYGPSESRNRVDDRYSRGRAWDVDFDLRYRGLKGYFVRMLDWAKPARIEPPMFKYDLEEIEANRQSVWARYNAHETAFLGDVLPLGVSLDTGRVALRRVMQTIMGTRDISPRLVLQLIGSEFGRAISVDIWIDRLIREALELLEQGKSVLVSDARFLNEVEKIVAAGGEVWLMDVVGAPELLAGVAGHASEKDLRLPKMRELVTRIIQNDKALGLEHLRGLVNSLLMDG